MGNVWAGPSVFGGAAMRNVWAGPSAFGGAAMRNPLAARPHSEVQA